ncbi:MAG TPA: transketolase C-terminal domain-containing protein [Nitrospira sp.]
MGINAIMTYRDALALAAAKEMDADPSVFVFGLDVPDHKRIFGSTKGLVEKFGSSRCFGTPLSEDAMTGVAIGAALSGLRPVHVHIRADFLLLGMNQIANVMSSLRYMSGGALRLPLVIRAVIGRGWGQGAQHSKSLHGLFGHFPGIKVGLPTSPQDAYSMLRAAIRDDNPVILLEHRWLYDIEGGVDEDHVPPLPGPVVVRAGRDATVACTSWMTIEAMKAAEVLGRHNVDIEVIDMRTVAPLDEEVVACSIAKTGHCLIADYDWLYAGFSAELAARIAYRCFGALRKPIERIGFAPVPCPTTRPLENLFYPSAVQIIRAVERLLDLKSIDLSQESFYSYEERFKGPF